MRYASPLKEKKKKKNQKSPLVLAVGIVEVRHKQPCSQPQCWSCWQRCEHCLSLQLLILNGPIPPIAVLLGSITPYLI